MAFERKGTDDNPVFVRFEYKGLADLLFKVSNSILVFKCSVFSGWLCSGKLVEPPLEASPNLDVGSLDHLQIVELALNHSLHIRLVRVEVMFGSIV